MIDQRLANIMIETATKSAAAYLTAHGQSADPSALGECIKSHVKAAIPGALHDAKDAIAAGMHSVAEQTFLASFTLAGIEAAKEASCPK